MSGFAGYQERTHQAGDPVVCQLCAATIGHWTAEDIFAQGVQPPPNIGLMEELHVDNCRHRRRIQVAARTDDGAHPDAAYHRSMHWAEDEEL